MIRVILLVENASFPLYREFNFPCALSLASTCLFTNQPMEQASGQNAQDRCLFVGIVVETGFRGDAAVVSIGITR